MGKHVIIFGADMNSSVHIDNKNKYIVIIGKGPTQGLDGTTLTAEANMLLFYTIRKKICINSKLKRKQQFLIC